MSAVSASGHIGRVVELAGAQRIADAGSAVADRHYFVTAVDIRDLMHKAMALRSLQDLQCFFIGDVAAHASVHAVLRHIAHTHAELAVDLSGALSAHGLLLAAGTLSDGILVILAEPVGDVLNAGGHVLAFNGLLYGNDVHAYAGASRRDHGSHILQRHLGHQVEESRKFGMLRRQFVVHHHELRGAGHEDRHIVLFVVIRILAVHLDQAYPDKMIHHFLCVLVRHLVHLREIFNVVGHAGFLKAQEELRLLLGQDLVKSPVLRIVCLHCPRILDEIPVRDHCPKLQDQFLFLLVRRNIVRVLSEVPAVDHAVFLVFHKCKILRFVHIFSILLFP